MSQAGQWHDHDVLAQVADRQRRLLELDKGRTANKLRSDVRAAYSVALASRSKASVPLSFKAYHITDHPAADTMPDESQNNADKNPLTADELRTYWQIIRTRHYDGARPHGRKAARAGNLVQPAGRARAIQGILNAQSRMKWLCRNGRIKVKLNATTNEARNTMLHTSTLRAAGGSIAVTIPQAMAKTTGLHPGDKVSFEFDAGRLIILPVSRRKYSLSELLAMQGAAPLLINKAWDTMPASGQEVPL